MTDLILTKAVEFTGTEFLCLGVWLVAEQAGNDELAREVLAKGLLAEHYRSLLSEDASEITPEQSETLHALVKQFEDAVGRAAASMAGNVRLGRYQGGLARYMPALPPPAPAEEEPPRDS